MEKYLAAIEGDGFRTWHLGSSAHVQQPNGVQVAVFRVTAAGAFEWGWVEHPDGNGRTDFWEWAAWWKALRKVKAA
jgi:hypothetical protein